MKTQEIKFKLRLWLYVKHLVLQPFRFIWNFFSAFHRPTGWFQLAIALPILFWALQIPLSTPRRIYWILLVLLIWFWREWTAGPFIHEYRQQGHVHRFDYKSLKVEGLKIELLKCRECSKIKLKGEN